MRHPFIHRCEFDLGNIDRVAIVDFDYQDKNLAAAAKHTHNHVAYKKGASMAMRKCAIVIRADDGSRDEYVSIWGCTRPALAQSMMLAPSQLGRTPSTRRFHPRALRAHTRRIPCRRTSAGSE